MRLGASRECCNFLVTDMHPLDLALAAQRVCETVQAIADDAVNPLDANRREGVGELVRNGRHPLAPSRIVAAIIGRLRAAGTRPE
jgi:hypothetical protein